MPDEGLDYIRRQIRDLSARDCSAQNNENIDALMAQLPESERLVWNLIGDVDPSLFDARALLIRYEKNTFDAIREATGYPLAMWPDVPGTEMHWLGSSVAPGPSMYDVSEPERVFATWPEPENQAYIDMNWGGFCSLLVSAGTSVSELLALLPAGHWQSTSQEVWLGRVSRVAEALGWAGTDVGYEPNRLLLFGSKADSDWHFEIEYRLRNIGASLLEISAPGGRIHINRYGRGL
jgi:hypothetical protein